MSTVDHTGRWFGSLEVLSKTNRRGLEQGRPLGKFYYKIRCTNVRGDDSVCNNVFEAAIRDIKDMVCCGLCGRGDSTICRECKTILTDDNKHAKTKKAGNICKKCEYYRSRKIKLAKIGATPELRQEMIEKQNKKCANPACYNECTELDHDHGKNFLREVLCRSCNLGLGHFPNVEVMQGVVAYWIKHNALYAAKQVRLATEAKKEGDISVTANA